MSQPAPASAMRRRSDRGYEAVIFDLDGTLLNTLSDIGTAANRALGRLGFEAHPMEAYRFFVGDGSKMLMTRALPEHRRDEVTVGKCLQLFVEEYGRTWNDRTRLYEGIPQLLDSLRDGKIRLAVLSNKRHAFTVQCVRHFLQPWHFYPVLGQREAVPPKPDPAGALEIAGFLKLPSSKILYLGDSGTDMRTARAAGMFPAGAGWGFRPESELRRDGAQTVIGHPLELLDFFAHDA